VRERIYIGALLVAIGTFHAATVRQGHLWADDFAMYVHHAKNIVVGHPYTDTNYIFNASMVVGPKYYPPIFPVLLAPIYRVSGLNLIPMKLEQVVFLLLSLVVIYAYWKRDLGSGYTLALVAILGFAPAFWIAKDNILSDILFVFFFYLTALLVRSSRRDTTAWWRWAVLIGFVIYLAIGTRVVGISLAAGLVLYDVVRLRTISWSTMVSIAICVAFVTLQRYVTGIGLSGYPQEHPTFHSIASNIPATRA
jgi:4-amino-4-deoxy-L-arabinose transferase-like glycosyltransferase